MELHSENPKLPTMVEGASVSAPVPAHPQPTDKAFDRQRVEEWENEGGFVPPIDDNE